MQNTQIDPHNHEQQLAYELVANTNSSFFLTGRAGTGKTTFLHNVQKLVGKQFITLAPTGVAASPVATQYTPSLACRWRCVRQEHAAR